MSDTPLSASAKSEAVLDFLSQRRSSLAKVMGGPGPSEDQLARILQISTRVPDHRKLAPYRFLTFEGKARENFGKHLGSVFQAKNPDMPLDRVLFESQRFLRAPVVVAVISAPVACPRATPTWEQQLVSAAVCFQMLLAARAMGFAGQWLTEWYAYDAAVQAALGMSEGENVAGFIYLGTAREAPMERARPDLTTLTSKWAG